MATKRVGRYGMTFSTIRYWQHYAASFVTYNGKRELFARKLRSLAASDMMDARHIGHVAIQAAAVCHPSAVRHALKGA